MSNLRYDCDIYRSGLVFVSTSVIINRLSNQGKYKLKTFKQIVLLTLKHTSAVSVGSMYCYRKRRLNSFFMDGQMRLCLKMGRQGYLDLL